MHQYGKFTQKMQADDYIFVGELITSKLLFKQNEKAIFNYFISRCLFGS